MEQLDKKIEYAEFLYLCDDLYSRLTPIEKNQILKSKNREVVGRPPLTPPSPSFTPYIS